MGAAYGTAKSGVAVASLGVMNPALVMKSMIPVVMAGVIGIYGLIVAVIIVGNIPSDVSSSLYCAKVGYAHFGSGTHDKWEIFVTCCLPRSKRRR